MTPMHIAVLEYDQDSAYEGLNELNRHFSEGWETLISLRYFDCCGIYRTTLYRPF